VLARRYVLGSELGRSGTGMVWEAHDQVLDRTVAVKVLRPSLADDPAFTSSLRRVAETVSSVSGPGLARLLDVGQDRGVSFLVREHVRGASLRAVVERAGGRLGPDEAAGIMLPVLEGLGSAHAAGLLHLDLKPDNVIVADPGDVRLTDLGLGPAVSAAYPPDEAAAVLGIDTPAPEQLAGATLDERTDVFLAGALLHELLTAEPPPVIGGARSLDAGIPPELRAVIAKALAPRPEDRYPDTHAFADALRSAVHAVEPRPSPGGRGGLHSWFIVPALIVMTAVAATGLGLWLDRLELGGPLGVRPKQEAPAPTPVPTPLAVEPQPLPIATVTTFDPFGDGAENDPTAPLATDGDVVTAWRSENYFDQTLNNKPGVGLLFDLGETHTVTGFRLVSPHPGFTFGLAIGDDLGRLPGAAAPDFVAETSMRVTVDAARGRYVLLWVTSVVEAGDGNRAEVAEFEVMGR
jgi:serine/threonine protein kinase